MTRLLEPENQTNDGSRSISPKPLITIGISTAAAAALLAAALKAGLVPSVSATAGPPTPTIAAISSALAEHQVSMEKQSAAEEKALARIVRLLELNCIQGAKTAYDRDACLRP